MLNVLSNVGVFVGSFALLDNVKAVDDLPKVIGTNEVSNDNFGLLFGTATSLPVLVVGIVIGKGEASIVRSRSAGEALERKYLSRGGLGRIGSLMRLADRYGQLKAYS